MNHIISKYEKLFVFDIFVYFRLYVCLSATKQHFWHIIGIDTSTLHHGISDSPQLRIWLCLAKLCLKNCMSCECVVKWVKCIVYISKKRQLQLCIWMQKSRTFNFRTSLSGNLNPCILGLLNFTHSFTKTIDTCCHLSEEKHRANCEWHHERHLTHKWKFNNSTR